MDPWIKKSIEIANAPRYLDRLSDIYPMNVNPERPLDPKHLVQIKQAYENKRTPELIRLLIDCSDIFPVKDSYIGFIKKKPSAISENPLTTERIGARLYSLGLEKMVQESQRPKETNRQLGNSFKGWVPSLGYRMVDSEQMVASNKGIVVLKGSDDVLGTFAREKLGCKIKKGIDLIVKKDKRYIIGEAKFLTTPGGEQDRGFDDASSFVKGKSGKATRIALIDGYIWLESLGGLHDKIVKSDATILSALLLKDFIGRF